MPNPRSDLQSLLSTPVRPGRLLWIGVRPARREPPQLVETVMADVGAGLDGDRYGSGGRRQVTLIQAEDLAAIASYLGRETVEPQLLRRNLVTRGINLLALKNKRFRVGAALLEYTGECHPCSRMEEALGIGGYNAVRGHGGITARVVCGGSIRIGDEVVALATETEGE